MDKLFTDSEGTDRTAEQLAEIDRTGKCPECDTEGLNSGCWFGTPGVLAIDLDCDSCGWNAEYETPRG